MRSFQTQKLLRIDGVCVYSVLVKTHDEP
jgi:hypothetical protein